MEAAIYNCQCDRMQNCEGGCETIYFAAIQRATDSIARPGLSRRQPDRRGNVRIGVLCQRHALVAPARLAGQEALLHGGRRLWVVFCR